MKTFLEIATSIGALVEEKNAAYGSSFLTAGAALRLLYPNGIRPEQMDDALLLARIWDKQMRIATDRDALGENPFADIAGYGILGVHMHQHRKEGQARCDAFASTAAHPSKEQPGASAPNDASGPTTTSARERNVEPSSGLSKLRSSSGYERMAVPAPTATVSVSAAVAALVLKAVRNNDLDLCGNCGRRTSDVTWQQHIADSLPFFCGESCAGEFLSAIDYIQRETVHA